MYVLILRIIILLELLNILRGILIKFNNAKITMKLSYILICYDVKLKIVFSINSLLISIFISRCDQ